MIAAMSIFFLLFTDENKESLAQSAWQPRKAPAWPRTLQTAQRTCIARPWSPLRQSQPRHCLVQLLQPQSSYNRQSSSSSFIICYCVTSYSYQPWLSQKSSMVCKYNHSLLIDLSCGTVHVVNNRTFSNMKPTNCINKQKPKL